MRYLFPLCLCGLLLSTASARARAQSEFPDETIQALRDIDPEIRRWAAYVLGNRRERQAVPELIERLQDEEQAVRETAAEALHLITGKDHGTSYLVWKDWWEKDGKQEFGPAEITGSEAERMRERVMLALGVVGVSVVLLILIASVLIFMGGYKIKELKETIRRADRFVARAEQTQTQAEKAFDRLETKKEEILASLQKAKEENEGEFERFSDLQERNLEHRLREITMELREKGEKELEQTLSQLRDQVRGELRRLFNERRDKTLANLEEREKRFFDEAEAHTLFLEASFYFSNRKYPEALKLYQRLLALKPNHHVAWNNKGSVLRQLRRYEEAIEAFEHGLEFAPNNAGLLYNVAATYAILRRKDRMLEFLGRAFQNDGEFKDEALNDEAFAYFWDDTSFRDLAEE